MTRDALAFRPPWLPLAICSALLCLGGAVPDAPRLRLHWQAPSSCPSEETFKSALHVGTPVAVFDDAEPTREVTVAIRETAQGIVGDVSVGRVGERLTPRRVIGEECATVVAALTFVAALALADDPQADAAHEEAARAFPVALPTPTAAPRAPAAYDVGRADFVPERRGEPSPWSVVTFGGSELQLLARPAPVLSAALGAQLELRHAIQPALRLDVASGASPRTRLDAGKVQLVLTLVRLELTPARLSLGRFRFGIGLGAELGQLVADGDDAVARSVRSRSPWLALTQRLRMDVRIRDGWYGELMLGLLEPLEPDYYVARLPDNPAYDVARVGFASAISVGYRFSGSHEPN